MATTKRILCLANSRKLSGRCIAGREWIEGGPGGWIRPVSSRHYQEVSEDERQYKDGSDPKLLDVIDVPLIQYHPDACQSENWLLDEGLYWQRIQHIGWNELQGFVQQPGILWINGQQTYRGLNDRIAESAADTLPDSLCLIHVSALKFRIHAPSEAFGNPKRKVQARFQYREINYALQVTDPVVERTFLAEEDGIYTSGESCLTISLSEPFNGFRYKLVAAVILRSEVSL